MGPSATEHDRKFILSLEGIRGYAFLAVFFAHYFLPWTLRNQHDFVFGTWTVLRAIAYFAVPIFFVLSGYLIGGILYDTRQREGYFKVFYLRRALRVLPIYYLALIVIACVDVQFRFHLDHRFWAHFFYIQNLLPNMPKFWFESPVAMAHLWSLAVEEQFYLLWPLVVWLFPQRRRLMVVVSVLIGVCWALRLAAPLLSWTPFQMFYLTPTRADAIMFGVLLSLLRGSSFLEKVKPLAKWFALAGVLVVAVRAGMGYGWADDYVGTEIVLPLLNLTALATIMAVIEQGSWLNRVCSKTWICWIGSRSYSLYIIHYMFYQWYRNTLLLGLSNHMRRSVAVLIGALIVLALTFVLSMLSYRYLEAPAMRLKKRIQYGAAKERIAMSEREETLVLAGD